MNGVFFLRGIIHMLFGISFEMGIFYCNVSWPHFAEKEQMVMLEERCALRIHRLNLINRYDSSSGFLSRLHILSTITIHMSMEMMLSTRNYFVKKEKVYKRSQPLSCLHTTPHHLFMSKNFIYPQRSLSYLCVIILSYLSVESSSDNISV